MEIYRREGQEEQLLELLHDPRFTAIVEGNNEFAHIKADLYLRNPPDALGSAATWVTGLFQRAAGDGGQWLRDDWQTWRLLTAGIAQGSVDDRSTV